MNRAMAGGLLCLAPLLACERDQPDRIPLQPTGGSMAGVVGEAHLSPGPDTSRMMSVRNPYADDPRAVLDGERLFVAYNCGACHGTRGGGGMGPPLRDDTWIYGGDAVSIYRSIMEGRPEGMPTWQGLLPDEQAWKIVAYIQAMGGPDESPPSMRPPASRTPPAATGEGVGGAPDMAPDSGSDTDSDMDPDLAAEDTPADATGGPGERDGPTDERDGSTGERDGPTGAPEGSTGEEPNPSRAGTHTPPAAIAETLGGAPGPAPEGAPAATREPPR